MVEQLQHRVREEFPGPARAILREGVNRLFEYQNRAYAELYLQRLMRIDRAERDAGGHGDLVREVGRHLSLWMSYEDVIRVAVDAQMAELIPENDFRTLRSELRLLEAGKMVVWKENLAEEMAEMRRRVRVDLDAISELQDMPFPGFLKEIKQLKALKGLEGHNYHFDERKLKDVIAKSMRTMEKDLKQMKEDLKDIPGVSGKSKS